MQILLKFKGYETLTEVYIHAIIISNDISQEQARLKVPPPLNSSAPPFFPRNPQNS